MKNYILLILTVFIFTKSNSQTFTISGSVKDEISGENLIGVTVYFPEINEGTKTNNFGFYSITLPSNELLLIEISYLGYKKQTITICLKTDLVKYFNLQKDENLINEITITANRNNNTEISTIEIPILQIQKLPSLGGEVDIMKSVQLMPGIQSGGEGKSGLYVRGGSPDQNLIILDDVPLYYVDHLAGFVSTFNADAINTIKIIKGGIPARYGGRLSSVVDVRMKDGNLKKYSLKGNIGIISSRLSFEGPIKKDTSSFIISARRMLLDLISKPMTYFATDGTSVGYYFYDINAKVNYKINRKNKLYLSIYKGNDKTSVNTSKNDDFNREKINNSLQYGNIAGALRWNHLFSNRLFANMTLTFTEYKYKTELKYKNTENEKEITEFQNIFNSNIDDINIKYDFEYYKSNKYQLRFGINSIFHVFTPGITSVKHSEPGESLIDTTYNNIKFNAFENNIYFENRIEISKYIKTNIGLRFSAYTINNKTFFSAEPRILLSFMLSQNFSLKTSYSQIKQNVHNLSYSGLGLPSDLWLPATKMAVPEKSSQFVLGSSTSLFNNRYDFSTELYYKELSNLITYKAGVSYFDVSKSWENNILTNGNGKSYGAEFLFQKKYGKITGWTAYTLSKTVRQFDELNSGKYYTFKYDRTHDISIVINYQINDKFNFSVSWVYGTGNAITLANEHYKLPYAVVTDEEAYVDYKDNYYTEVFGEKNSFRMRDFHKLDIGINYVKKKTRGTRTWNVSVYNVYNRQNPYYYFFKKIYEKDIQGNDTDKYEIKMYQQSLFPIIPSISYSFSF